MSTETQHTPGPWEWVGSQIVAPNATDQFGTTPVEVLDLTGAMGGDDTKADSCLIAAAPELLEGARRALEWIEGPGFHPTFDEASTPFSVALWAAIRKASGVPLPDNFPEGTP